VSDVCNWPERFEYGATRQIDLKQV